MYSHCNFFPKMNKKILIAYYSVLVLVLISWSNPTSLPPTPLRLIFLVSVLAPLFLKARELFFVVFFFFVILSGSNHAVSYMPATGPYLAISAVIGALVFKPLNTIQLSLPKSFLALTLLVIINDLFASGRVSPLFYSLFLTIVISYFFISRSLDEQIEAVKISFVLLTIILSVEYFIWGSQFSTTVMVRDQDFERLGWSDPNYFSCVLGFGTLLSFSEIINKEQKGKKYILFYFAAIALSTYVIIATASRGAVVALIISFALLVLFSERRVGGKVIFLLLSLAFVFLFFKSGLLDLLFGRFAADDGTAGDRTIIWATKLKAFFEHDGLPIFFGCGLDQGRQLGFSKPQGFHNDFLAFLVCYGVLGLVLFLLILMYPVFYKGANKRVIIPYISYIAAICMSLEPISSGNLIYFYFYIYIIMLCRRNQQA